MREVKAGYMHDDAVGDWLEHVVKKINIKRPDLKLHPRDREVLKILRSFVLKGLSQEQAVGEYIKLKGSRSGSGMGEALQRGKVVNEMMVKLHDEGKSIKEVVEILKGKGERYTMKQVQKPQRKSRPHA